MQAQFNAQPTESLPDSVEQSTIYLQRVPRGPWHVMQPGSGSVGGRSRCGQQPGEWHRIAEELPADAIRCGECAAGSAWDRAVANDAAICGDPHWTRGPHTRHVGPLFLRAAVPVLNPAARRGVRPGWWKRLARWGR